MNTLEKVLKLIDEKKDMNPLSDIALDKAIGLKRSSIANWRLGRGTPSTDAIVKIAAYFDVTTDYLLGKTDAPNTESAPTPLTTQTRPDLKIPKILTQAGISVGFNNGVDDITQEELDDLALALELSRKRRK